MMPGKYCFTLAEIYFLMSLLILTYDFKNAVAKRNVSLELFRIFPQQTVALFLVSNIFVDNIELEVNSLLVFKFCPKYDGLIFRQI